MKKLVFVLLVVAIGTLPTSATAVNNPASSVLTDEFKKIDPAELPAAVVQALIKEYPTSRLSEAFKNRQGKYKLIMVLKSGSRRTVYIDTYGRWASK
ncbi:MAG: hypothetical protein AAF717_04060 [Bacteroidota bacterium]